MQLISNTHNRLYIVKREIIECKKPLALLKIDLEKSQIINNIPILTMIDEIEIKEKLLNIAVRILRVHISPNMKQDK